MAYHVEVLLLDDANTHLLEASFDAAVEDSTVEGSLAVEEHASVVADGIDTSGYEEYSTLQDTEVLVDDQMLVFVHRTVGDAFVDAHDSLQLLMVALVAVLRTVVRNLNDQ